MLAGLWEDVEQAEEADTIMERFNSFSNERRSYIMFEKNSMMGKIVDKYKLRICMDCERLLTEEYCTECRSINVA